MKSTMPIRKIFLITVLVSIVVLFALLGTTWICNQNTSSTVYDTTSPNCTYYLVKDIPNCIENYTGYVPFVHLDKEKKEASVCLKNHIFVTLSNLKHFGEDLWALELENTPENADYFQRFAAYSYADIFSKQRETKEGGIYYDLDTIQELFENATGVKVIFQAISANDSSVTLYAGGHEYRLHTRVEYVYSETNDLLVNARLVSQIVYDFQTMPGGNWYGEPEL